MNNYSSYSHSGDDINWYDNAEGPSIRTRMVFAIIWIFIAVSGILGNSLVIFVAIRFEKLSNVTNCYIVNLAVTDILFLVFCMPLLVAQYTVEYWYFNQTFCKLLNFISFLSVLVTVLTLVIMTIDRYVYIAHPFENIKWRKPKAVFLLSLIIWLLSCVMASPFYLYYGIPSENYTQCVLLIDEGSQKQFRIYTVTLYYFIPLTIILICYTRLLCFVFSKENKLKPKTKSNLLKWSKRRRAVTKMVAIVTLVFSLCWLPITLYIVSANFFEHRTAFLYYFKMIANSFAYMNSAINPILYAFLNRSFRNNCGNILWKPTCSLISSTHCSNQGEQQQRTIPKQKTYSYRPKDRYSAIDHKIIIENNDQLVSDDILSNDFSDAEYEAQEDDCVSHVIINKIDHQHSACRQKHGSVPIDPKAVNNRYLTTSL